MIGIGSMVSPTLGYGGGGGSSAKTGVIIRSAKIRTSIKSPFFIIFLTVSPILGILTQTDEVSDEIPRLEPEVPRLYQEAV